MSSESYPSRPSDGTVQNDRAAVDRELLRSVPLKQIAASSSRGLAEVVVKALFSCPGCENTALVEDTVAILDRVLTAVRAGVGVQR